MSYWLSNSLTERKMAASMKYQNILHKRNIGLELSALAGTRSSNLGIRGLGDC